MRTVESSTTRAMRSAGAAPIGMALGSDPLGGIVIPVMAGAGQSAEGGLDVVPAGLVVERAPYQLGDEGAAPPATGAGIQLGDEVGLELNVHTHVSKSTHSLRQCPSDRTTCRGNRAFHEHRSSSLVDLHMTFTVRQNVPTSPLAGRSSAICFISYLVRFFANF